MRVLVANKFWYRRGGLEQVMFDEIDALTCAGHEVAHFSTAHPRNQASPFSDYFVPYLDLGGQLVLTPGQKVTAALRLFDNAEAAKRFRRLVRDFRPDVVHAHGIHRQLSPSILEVARREGVPVVQTLHDMHKLCPEDRLLRAGSEACVPPRCGKLWYGAAVTNRCAHGSAAVSALAACELAYQRMRGVYERCVARYLSPSRFLAERMRESGWRRTPIDILRNPVAPGESGEAGDYFLYAGRLAQEKGIDKLLEAADIARLHVIVAGDGPMRERLRERFPNAEFVGHLEPAGVRSLLRHARAAVLPSTCVENAPLAVLEAMASGVPVIATAVGGVPELLDDGVEGLLVPPGDVAALQKALVRLASNPDYGKSLGAAGRSRAAHVNGIDRHLDGLLEAYASVMGAA